MSHRPALLDVDRSTLAALLGGSQTGLQLAARSSGTIPHAEVYDALGRLLQRRLVVPWEDTRKKPESGDRRRFYQLTDQGDREARRVLRK